MEDLVCLALSLLGLMSMLKGESANTSVYEADFTFHRPATAILGYYDDDEQISQVYRRTRVKARRTNASL